MRNKNKRLAIVAFFGLLIVAGVTLMLSALQSNTQFFYDPSEIVATDFSPSSDTIRVGGLVVPGTLEQKGGIRIAFNVIDFVEGEVTDWSDERIIYVEYSGVVPDLFREGEGVVMTGELLGDNEFRAVEILAKHDENYQPVKNDSKGSNTQYAPATG